MAEHVIPEDERRKRKIGLILYIVGLVLGFTIAILAIWGDLEASLFDVMFRQERTLNSLSCPVLITAGEETAVIGASFKNDGDKDENLLVRAHVTLGGSSLIREELAEITLAPGEEKKLSWPIEAGDAAWDRIVMARVTTVRSDPFRERVGAACGVLVVPVQGVTGGQIVLVTLVISAILLAAGGWLWGIGRRPLLFEDKQIRRRMILFAGLMLAGLLVSFLKLWMLGLVVLILVVLLLISAISH